MPGEATLRSLHSSPDSSTLGNLAVGSYWWKLILWGSWLIHWLASLWGHWHVSALSSSFFIAILNDIQVLVSQCSCLQRNTSQWPSTQQQPQQETFQLYVLVTQLCLTLCDPTPGSSAHGISQAGTLEWVVISYSRELISSWPRDWSQVSCISRWILYHWATSEAHCPPPPPKKVITTEYHTALSMT